MKCPYCGKDLAEGTVTCDGCGADTSAVKQQTQNINNQSTQFNNQTQKSGNKSGVIILLLFLVIAGLLCYFLLFNGDSSDSNNSSNNEENNEEVEDNAIMKSRKNAYLSMAATYSTAIKMLIVDGHLKIYNPDTILLVPVGDNTKCGNLEAGGSSPFSSGWNYAYVGIIHDDDLYNTYFISEDDSLYGMPLLSYDQLLAGSIEKIYNKHNDLITDEVSNKLKELYEISENQTFDSESIGVLKDVLTPSGKDINKFVFVSASAGCKN